jgi:hypothetical protein
MKAFYFLALITYLAVSASAFTVNTPRNSLKISPTLKHQESLYHTSHEVTKSTSLHATPPDLAVVSLVAGQENYGLAIVALGEAIWSFSEAPSLSHAKVLVPAIIAAIILFAVSGPMVTNAADAASISLGLEIATGVSVFLGATYVLRLLAPFSPSAKEIAFLGLLFSVAGFFSFSQNLVVDGFVNLPDLPELPSIFPKNEFEE